MGAGPPRHPRGRAAPRRPDPRGAAAHPALWTGRIERFELPALGGLNFVFHDALEGGVNASLNLDAHGKSFGFLLLALPIDIATDEAPPRQP